MKNYEIKHYAPKYGTKAWNKMYIRSQMYRGKTLDDVYMKYSENKVELYNRHMRNFNRNPGATNFRIVAANKYTFTVAWDVPGVMIHVEASRRTFDLYLK